MFFLCFHEIFVDVKTWFCVFSRNFWQVIAHCVEQARSFRGSEGSQLCKKKITILVMLWKIRMAIDEIRADDAKLNGVKNSWKPHIFFGHHIWTHAIAI